MATPPGFLLGEDGGFSPLLWSLPGLTRQSSSRVAASLFARIHFAEATNFLKSDAAFGSFWAPDQVRGRRVWGRSHKYPHGASHKSRRRPRESSADGSTGFSSARHLPRSTLKRFNETKVKRPRKQAEKRLGRHTIAGAAICAGEAIWYHSSRVRRGNRPRCADAESFSKRA